MEEVDRHSHGDKLSLLQQTVGWDPHRVMKPQICACSVSDSLGPEPSPFSSRSPVSSVK